MSEHKKIPVILDGDPGHDDAIAWVLARASRELGILAVTSCCGNQTIEKTTYNALRVCTLIGLHAPVGKGCPHPLLNDVMNAPSVHGESGLDGPALPEPAFEASALSAPELMAKVLRESPEPVTIVATVFVLTALNTGSPYTALIECMSGGLLFGSVFMATDYVTSPFTTKGKLFYGVFIGLVTFLIRHFGSMNEGMSYAILLGNLMTPWFNAWGHQTPLGYKKPQKAAKGGKE